MILSPPAQSQVFITAHSNNAAEQLARYVIEMDGLNKAVLPFVLRLGDQSGDDYISQFTMISYVLKIAQGLCPGNCVDYSVDEGDIGVHFNKLSEKLIKAIGTMDLGFLISFASLSKEKIDTLKRILKHPKQFMHWILYHASVIIGTTTGLSMYIKHLVPGGNRRLQLD